MSYNAEVFLEKNARGQYYFVYNGAYMGPFNTKEEARQFVRVNGWDISFIED